jgi:hypothetical protein
MEVKKGLFTMSFKKVLKLVQTANQMLLSKKVQEEE